MSELQALKTAILADGKVDANEVAQLRHILLADGKIDKEEATLLFEINDSVSGKGNAPEWDAFFVEALTSFVLDDEGSPGSIDEDEAAFLVSKIEGDGQVDGNEKALLAAIKQKATGTIPAALQALLAKV